MFIDTLRNEFDNGLDLIVGGPPCQGFSTSGRRALDDPRNSMVNNFLYAIETLSPRAFIMENVTGFTTMQNGAIFLESVDRAVSLGYEVHAAVLLASAYGVPQRRRRFFLIGIRDGVFEFPRPKSLLKVVGKGQLELDMRPQDLLPGSEVTFLEATSDLPYIRPGGSSSRYRSEPGNSYQRLMRRGVTFLTEHNSANHSQRVVDLIRHIPKGSSAFDPDVWSSIPEHLRPTSGFSNCYKRIRANEPSPTITRNFTTPSSANCIHPTASRALTLREGARCQSFPDSFRFVGSTDERRLQIGNAVPPLLAESLGRAMIKALSA
jgi:DNA (cytosine-5)-methyltransferase 1